MERLDVRKYIDFITARYPGVDASSLETFMEVVNVAKAMNGGMDAYFQTMGMSQAGFKLLMVLLRNPQAEGCSPAFLAEAMGVKRATVTGILDTLENNQWVERLPDPNDRRGLLIRLTEAGTAKLDGVLPAHYERASRAMETFSSEEHKQLRVLMRKFGQGLTAMEASAVCNKAPKDVDSGVERE